MSDRRRSLLILLLVFGLIAASAVVVATKETKLGLDLQGGVQLVYEGQPTPQQPTVDQQALDRALQIMRDRVDAFGVAEPELQLIGGRQIEVNLPGVENADRAADAGRLHRPAVLLRLGSEHPRRGVPDQRHRGRPAASSRSRPARRGRAGRQVHRRDDVRRQRRRVRRRASTRSTRSPSSRSRTRRAWTPARPRSRPSTRRTAPTRRSSRSRRACSSSATRRARPARTARSRPIPTAGG